MFRSIEYWRELYRLQKGRSKTEAYHSKKMSAAETRKASDEEMQFLHSDLYRDLEEYDDELGALQSRYLQTEAERLGLPLPEFRNDSPDWVESSMTGRWRLSISAMASLRGLVRKERKERREVWQFWFALIGGLVGMCTGLIGTTIGLLAYLDRLPIDRLPIDKLPK